MNMKDDDLETPQITGISEEYDFQNIFTNSALQKRCNREQINDLSEVLEKKTEGCFF